MSPRPARAVRFEETMEGWLRRPGEASPRRFRFDIRVTVPEGTRTFGTSHGRVTGTVNVDGLVTAAPATGSLLISPWERRLIRYVLDFPGDDGRALRFEGTKRISYARPLQSWTTLPGEVREGDRPWGRAVLRFSMRTFPAFLGSMRRAPRVPRSAIGFAEALLGSDGNGDGRAAAARVTALSARFPWMARRGLGLGMAAVDAAAVAMAGRRLIDLGPRRREEVLRGLAGWTPSRRILDALKMPVVAAHASAQAAAEVLERSGRSELARPDPELDVTPASDWPSTSRADVVIVGSGAGGAMAARTLARAGLSTIVLEEGRRFTSEEFRTHAPLERYATLYRDAGVSYALGNPPVLLPLGRAVGGTTVVNAGTCYRTPDPVLRRWRDGFGLGLADPDAFAPYLDEVERTIMVAPVSAEILGRNGELVLAGARSLGWSAAPLRRNAPGCEGCCQCIVGCPRNAKYGVHLNALPEACRSGARIVSEARAERILTSNGRGAGVLARRRDGSTFRIEAARVVVAAGATEAPPLLRRSGLGSHPHLGRNLTVHPAVSILGRFEEPVRSWEGVLQSVGVDEFHEREGILIEATSAPQGLGAASIPGYGRRLREGLAQADRFAAVGALVADAPAGRVYGRRRAAVRYDLAPGDARRLFRAIEVMGRLLLAAGAVEVHTGISGAEPARTTEEVDDRVAHADRRLLRLAAFHPSGTLRAGADPERCPVDADGRLRGIEGVWVADASILPSGPGVNPQVTIMAAALAVAERVVGPGP